SQLRDGRLLLLLQRSEPLSELFLFGLVGILELFHPAFRLGELSLGRLIRLDQRMVVRQSIRHTWCRIRSRLRFGSRLLDSWLISHDQISPVSGTGTISVPLVRSGGTNRTCGTRIMNPCGIPIRSAQNGPIRRQAGNRQTDPKLSAIPGAASLK